MRTRAFACRISPLPVYASFDRTMRIFRSALFAGGTAPNHAEFPLWSPRLGSVYTQQPSFVSTKYRLFFGRPSRGGLFGTFHVKRHLAGIGGFGRDHLKHHPAVGRPLEEPVVSDRQGSRRGEVEGKGGGGGLVAAHPSVFYGAGGIGGNVSGEMHARRMAVAGDGRRVIQEIGRASCRER